MAGDPSEVRSALDSARQMVRIIHEGEAVPSDTITAETVENWETYFSPGFIEYRKSVSEAGDYAAIEWTGQGSHVRDHRGREWIDCLGGYGIYDLGIRHPEVVESVRRQLDRNPMPSQELLDPFKGMLTRLLVEITPGDLSNVFVVNSGTEAVECALKLARAATRRTGFLCFDGGFHGKTLGSLSLIGKAHFREPVGELLPGIRRAPFGDADIVEDILEREGNHIAAVVLEPIQGEAGAVVPPDDFLPRVRAACDRHGVLLIADEVQTGLGRTGKLWAVQHWDVVPDILCVAKSLGGGVMPIGAVVARAPMFEIFKENPWFHSSTFGGNPMACAAAITAIYVTLRDRLWEVAAVKGERFMTGLMRLRKRYPHILAGVRGKGLLIGMVFPDDVTGYQVAAGMFRRGVLVAGTLTSATTIRIEPALQIPDEMIDEVLLRLDETLASMDA
jgi:putrescine aminotransferase